MKKIFQIILSIIPYLYIVALMSNMFYLAFISVFPRLINTQFEIVTIRTLLLFVSLYFFNKYRILFNVSINNLKFYQYFVFAGCFMVIIMRFPIYFPLTDDLILHLPAGDIVNTIWSTQNFKLLESSTYSYHLPQMIYTPFLYTVGMRMTILIIGTALTIWYFSLYLRFCNLINNSTQKIFLALVFIYTYFSPHFMATLASFMIDFVSLNLILEAFYQLISKNRNKTFAAIIVILALITKQSTGIFLIPILQYFVVINFRQIKWIKVGLFAFLFSLFFIRSYFEIGNPLIGLFNWYFKSSLFPIDKTIEYSGVFGPNSGIVNLLLWPIVGQFSNHWAEGWVSTFSRYFFSAFPVIPYVLSIYFFIVKRKLLYLIFFLSIVFWSLYFGYPRFYISLNLVVMIYLIINQSIKIKFLIQKSALIVFIFMLLSLNSIQTDFGWRPVPYAKVLGQVSTSPTYYLYRYKEGLRLLFKDTIPQMAEYHKDEFEGYEVIIPYTRGWHNAYAYLASTRGVKVVNAESSDSYKQIMSDPKISDHLKENLSNTFNANKILLVMEENRERSLDYDKLFISEKFVCHKLARNPKFKYFQTVDYFSSISLHECLKK